ncbi:MAG: DUF58 domain-containing protein [Mycobacteriales bacterium]
MARLGSAGALLGDGLLARIERRFGITVTGVVLIFVVVIGWVVARLVQSREMSLLAYGLLLLTVASALVARRRLPVDAVRADLPTRVREGQTIEVNVTLTARRRVTGIILEDELPPQLGDTARLPLAVLPSGQEVMHAYGFVPRLRGVYKIGPLVAITSDAFGLTKRRIQLAEPAEIIVHPKTEPVHDRVLSREWEDPPVRPPIAKPWPTGFEFYGMRDYQPGDDPRRIMWRAAARSWDPDTGLVARYMVRESEQGITDRVSLVLDTQTRLHSRGEPSETFETAVRAFASLGVRHIKDGFSVTAYTNTEKIANMLRGSRAQLPYLDAMARLHRQSEPLSGMLQRILTAPRGHTHLVLVVPEVGEDAVRALRIMLDRGASVMIVLIRWDESDPASEHRVAALGCNFVELRPNQPLDRVFASVHGVGARR